MFLKGTISSIYCAAGLFGKKKRNVRKPPRRVSASSSTTSNPKGVKTAPAKSTASKVCVHGRTCCALHEIGTMDRSFVLGLWL